MRKTRKSIRSISKYLPILIILLSITIMVGSTFAYFTDRKEDTSNLTFSKVELSSETTLGVDGAIHDVIPGSKLIDGEVAFSKAIDSEAIYVRAKVSFSLPSEYKNDTDMQGLLDKLRSATNFNIESGEQAGGAVWSEKMGNYFYLVTKDDATKLMRVDTIDTYVLSSDMVVPRDLEQLEGNAQYMKSINFHIAFEAIQADNVSDNLADTKEVFNELFPESDNEKCSLKVTFKDEDMISNLKVVLAKEGEVLLEPEVDIPVDENGLPKYVIDGWYLDSELVNQFDFGGYITEEITLYPKVLQVSKGLQFNEVFSSQYGRICTVSKGTCEDNEIVIPDTYNNIPVVEVELSAFRAMTNITSVRLSKNIKKFNQRAFEGCSNLRTINLPDELTNLPTSLFKGCTNLVIDELPDTITYIGGSAFENCISLALTKLPISLNDTGSTVFKNCTNLALTELPSGFTYIYFNTFQNCTNLALTSLPDRLTYIGDYAFYDCPNIKITSIPEGVTYVGNYAFYGCTSLNYILCESEAVATLVQGKGREDSCIYVKQVSAAIDGTIFTDVVINDTLTIRTAVDIDCNIWVRIEDVYYKCLVLSDTPGGGDEGPSDGSNDFNNDWIDDGFSDL